MGGVDFVYVAPAQAARIIGVSRSSVFRWLRAGQLRAVRVGSRAVRVAVPAELFESWRKTVEASGRWP